MQLLVVPSQSDSLYLVVSRSKLAYTASLQAGLHTCFGRIECLARYLSRCAVVVNYLNTIQCLTPTILHFIWHWLPNLHLLYLTFLRLTSATFSHSNLILHNYTVLHHHGPILFHLHHICRTGYYVDVFCRAKHRVALPINIRSSPTLALPPNVNQSQVTERGVGGAIGKGLLGGIGTGVVGTLLGDVLNRDVESPKFQRGVGGSVVNGAAGGAASSLVTQAIDEAKKILRREIEDELIARGIGGSVAGGAAGGAASALTTQVIDEAKKILKRQIDDKILGRGVGESLVGGAAGGGASALVTQAIDEAKKLLRRDLESQMVERGIGSSISKVSGAE